MLMADRKQHPPPPRTVRTTVRGTFACSACRVASCWPPNTVGKSNKAWGGGWCLQIERLRAISIDQMIDYHGPPYTFPSSLLLSSLELSDTHVYEP